MKFRFSKKVVGEFLKLQWWNLPVDQIKQIVPLLSKAPNEEVIKEIMRRAGIMAQANI